MHFYYAFLAIDFAFGIHGLVPGQQLINIIQVAIQKGKVKTLRKMMNTKRNHQFDRTTMNNYCVFPFFSARRPKTTSSSYVFFVTC